MNVLRMTMARVGRYSLTTWLLILSKLVLAADLAVEQPAGNSLRYELILEGDHIKKLTLLDEQGRSKEFTCPGSSVLLPPGRYSIQEVEMQPGHTSVPYDASAQVVIAPDKPYSLGIGSPPMPSLAVKRAGRLLKMDCQLLDTRGEPRRTTQRDNPPKWAVYRGDELIASGLFEYG